MAGFAQSPLTGSSWNDLAGQAAQDTKDELAKRKKAQQNQMLADPMTGQSVASQIMLPAGGQL